MSPKTNSFVSIHTKKTLIHNNRKSNDRKLLSTLIFFFYHMRRNPSQEKHSNQLFHEPTFEWQLNIYVASLVLIKWHTGELNQTKVNIDRSWNTLNVENWWHEFQDSHQFLFLLYTGFVEGGKIHYSVVAWGLWELNGCRK